MSQTFGFFVPYTGTINPQIQELDVGRVRVLGSVDIQPPLVTLAHFQPLEAKFSSSTSGTNRKIPLPESENVLRLSRKAECQQALMPDCRRVRNHLRSVHAIALANIGEAVTGLALSIALPSESRIILTDFRIKFLKKARGPIIGVCDFVPPAEFVEGELEVSSLLLDVNENIVATVVAIWKVN